MLDEAGMIGTRDLDQVMDRVRQANGKLVLAGDTASAATMKAAARAWPRISRSQSSAVRFVKYPPRGRPRPDHAGPIVRFTCRPSGSRYFARQTTPRGPS